MVAMGILSQTPVAVQELLLRGDGIGSARFGAAPEGVIEYVASILGGNTADTGWVDPLTFAVCDGTFARRVDWGVLSLLFSDLSDVADGRRHFMGYEYGRDGQVGDEPVGLRTAGGTTLGSRPTSRMRRSTPVRPTSTSPTTSTSVTTSTVC